MGLCVHLASLSGVCMCVHFLVTTAGGLIRAAVVFSVCCQHSVVFGGCKVQREAREVQWVRVLTKVK